MRQILHIHLDTGEIGFIQHSIEDASYEFPAGIPTELVIYKLRVIYNAWWIRANRRLFDPIKSFPSPYDNASHRIE